MFKVNPWDWLIAYVSILLACYRQRYRKSHSLQCGSMSLRVMVASMSPCGSLVAMYTSSSNCAQQLQTLAEPCRMPRAHKVCMRSDSELTMDNQVQRAKQHAC